MATRHRALIVLLLLAPFLGPACGRPVHHSAGLRSQSPAKPGSSLVAFSVQFDRYHPGRGSGDLMIFWYPDFLPGGDPLPREYLERSARLYLLDVDTAELREVRSFARPANDEPGEVVPRGPWVGDRFHVEIDGPFEVEGVEGSGRRWIRVAPDGRYEGVEAPPLDAAPQRVEWIRHWPRTYTVRLGENEVDLCIEPDGRRLLTRQEEGFLACRDAR